MIAQADSRKWMACLYNSFLFMEAKIMKMAKKFLAVALAGVLALSVLTGCGDSANTKSIAEAMSDMYTAEGITFKEKSELNTKAKEIVEALAKAEAEPVALAEDDTEETEAKKAKIMDIMGDSYNKKFVWISWTETKGYNATAQASNLLRSKIQINPSEDEGKQPAKTWYIGTTTVTKDGKTYRFAVITAEAQASADGGNTDQGNTDQQ